jgi:RNA polymerase sigma-70 factor (ECF subfamily)
LTAVQGTNSSAKRHNTGEHVESDARLIDQTLNGDCQAFGQLARRYQNRLYNTIVHVLNSREDAEDIVQDTLVQAFVKLDTFRAQSSFYTWLYRIAFNYSITKLRRKKEVNVDYRDESAPPVYDHGDPPDGHLLRDERARRVRQALSVLPDEYRAVLVLRELEDCGYADISEILDLPIGTVRSRIHRARSQMRYELQDLLQDIPPNEP